MKSISAQSLLGQIDFIISNINTVASNNITQYSISHPIESSYLAGYLVTYISGIYEESVETIIKEKFARAKKKYVSRYSEKTLGRLFRNPNINKIIEILNLINKNWGEKINRLPEVNRSALNSIVGHKNALAHGVPTNVTLREVIQYYNDSKIIIEEIDKLLL